MTAAEIILFTTYNVCSSFYCWFLSAESN